jgi:hypothetical protein
VQDLVAKHDPAKSLAAREAHGADAVSVRSGDHGISAAIHDTSGRRTAPTPFSVTSESAPSMTKRGTMTPLMCGSVTSAAP